jgi:hypothetical protein
MESEVPLARAKLRRHDPVSVARSLTMARIAVGPRPGETPARSRHMFPALVLFLAILASLAFEPATAASTVVAAPILPPPPCMNVWTNVWTSSSSPSSPCPVRRRGLQAFSELPTELARPLDRPYVATGAFWAG